MYPGLIDLHSHILYNLRGSGRRRGRSRTRATTSGRTRTPIRRRSPGRPSLVEVARDQGGARLRRGEGDGRRDDGDPGRARHSGSLRGLPRPEHRQRDLRHRGTTGSRSRRSRWSWTTSRSGPQKMKDGDTFVYHLAEGTTPTLLDEFADVSTAKCLEERLVAIHATALGAAQFEQWSPHAGSIVWSPFSNLFSTANDRRVGAAEAPGFGSASARTGRLRARRTSSASSRSPTSGTASTSTGASRTGSSARW